MLQKKPTKAFLSLTLNEVIFTGAMISLIWWISGKGLFYSDHAPVLSPFTSLSLLGMTGVRLAAHRVFTWGKPMSLAILGVVACGNASSLLMLTLVPSLVLETLPTVVPTSMFTSLGLILFCLYEVIVLIRTTPKSFFILDDILLHLALFPGGLSLLGHALGSPTYLSSSADPRVGIGFLEMVFMAAYAVSCVLANRNLFLWDFLRQNRENKIIFAALFVSQYVVPLVVGLFLVETQNLRTIGPELFVMLAGVLATLLFLSIQAYLFNRQT